MSDKNLEPGSQEFAPEPNAFAARGEEAALWAGVDVARAGGEVVEAVDAKMPTNRDHLFSKPPLGDLA